MAAKGMVLLDEIRGRLAEVFSLKTYKIDHVYIYNIFI
jgi:2-methylcitrate dehydratase